MFKDIVTKKEVKFKNLEEEFFKWLIKVSMSVFIFIL